MFAYFFIGLHCRTIMFDLSQGQTTFYLSYFHVFRAYVEGITKHDKIKKRFFEH